MIASDATRSSKRRLVVVEYDVTRMTAKQVDALLLHVLVGDQDVSIKIEVKP